MLTRFIITAYSVTAILLTGCSDAAYSAPTATDDNVMAAQSAPEKHVNVPAQTIEIKQLAGTWKIMRLWVDTSGISAWGLDDPSAIGSMLTISPESAHWSYPASDRFIGMDICTTSAPIILKENMGAFAVPNESVSAATTYFGIPVSQLSPTYKMTWSDSSPNDSTSTSANNFTLTADGRMVMIWYDGAILLLKRQ